jgi:hypothetical protein
MFCCRFMQFMLSQTGKREGYWPINTPRRNMNKLQALSLTAALLLTLTASSALGLSVPVAQDASSTTTGKITIATGKATNLPVNSKQTAFIRFNLADLAVVPAAITPADISSATLRLYVTGIKPGDLTVHAVTSDWTETPSASGSATPIISGSVLATIPAVETLGKHFVTVDITTAIKADLANVQEFGFAIETAVSGTKVYLGSKEGPGLGEAAQLDIETNLENATGNVTIPGTLSVSTSFVAEARPNATGGLNVFIGGNAGLVDTTGYGNTFVGYNSGKANIGGSSNCFYGLNAGSSNTSGQLNVFLGQGAGAFNDSGSNNNFVGQAAGFNSFSGNANNYFGWHAGFSNSGGSDNAFFGDQAGAADTASNNCFFGSGAGSSVSIGTQECFFGINAGNKTTGAFNSFFGAGAGQFTTNGAGNSFFGNIAGTGITTGANNAFFGGNTGASLTQESHNTLLGDSTDGAAGITYSAAIGANAKVTASDSIVLGGINGVNGASADTNVGIGVTAPNSTLQVNGSVSLAIRSVTNSILAGLTSSDHVLIVFGTTATSVGLPSPVSGRVYIIKNRSSQTVTLAPLTGLATVDGSASIGIAANAVAQVISDGANWFKIN